MLSGARPPPPPFPAPSIPGRILPGILADKVGRYNTIIAVTFVSAVICLAVWIPIGSTAGIIAFVTVFGFSSGGFVSLAPACVAQISEMRDMGTRVGTAFAVQSFGALTGSPIGGAIAAAHDGSFLGLQLFCGLCMLAGSTVLLFARFIQVGLKATKV